MGRWDIGMRSVVRENTTNQNLDGVPLFLLREGGEAVAVVLVVVVHRVLVVEI